MKRTLSGAISLAALLMLVECRPADHAPAASSAAKGSSRSPYLLPDGTVDYAAIGAAFGEPNQNLTLNPRSIDVATKPSASGMVVGAQELSFPASTSAWVLAEGPGDVLYCAHCAGTSFLRRVTSVQRRGADWIVVETTNGVLTDVVQRGWLRGIAPFAYNNPGTPGLPGAAGPLPGGVVGYDDGLNNLASESANEGSDRASTQFQFGITGSIQYTPSFTGNVALDTVIDGNVWSGVTVQLVKFEITATMTTSISGNLTGSAAIKEVKKFLSDNVPIGEILLGPVPVTPSFVYSVTGTLAATGKFGFTESAVATDTIDMGFQYTQETDVTPIWSTTHETNAAQPAVVPGFSVTMASRASVGFAFQFFGIAGPEIDQFLELGFEVNANPTETTADFYGEVGAAVGATLNVFNFQKGLALTLGTYVKETYPDPSWVIEGGTDPCDGNCDSNATCVSDGGMAGCMCNSGFMGAGTSGTCLMAEACATDGGSWPCDPNATCASDGGVAVCACNSGFTGTGMPGGCAAAGSCASDGGSWPCDPNATCASDGGMVACTCDDGFTGNGMPGNCAPGGSCATDGGSWPCDPNATCASDGGMVACTCNDGFTGNGMPGNCTSAGSCAADGGAWPCDSNAICASDGGIVACTCNSGFTGDGMPGNCAADGGSGPCATDGGSWPCDTNATCSADGGVAVCACDMGFSGDGMPGDCAAAGPCAMDGGSWPCDSTATCSADDGGNAACTCNSGFTGDGMPGDCAAAGPCATDGGSWPCDSNATCSADDGGNAVCACNSGFVGSGQPGTCCQSDPTQCTAQCVDNCGQACSSGQGACP